MSKSFSLQLNGDSAVDIRFDEDPSEPLSKIIIGLQRSFESAIADNQWPEIRELIPAYQCLTLCYDPLLLTSADGVSTAKLRPSLSFMEKLRGFVQQKLSTKNLTDLAIQIRTPELVQIPVCYENEYATDLDDVCAHTGLSREKVIALHSAPKYLVYMLGFSPGFLYLGGLHQKIHCPRKQHPTLRVAAGSVGIGGAQTGIYPQATPGGWQIIGRTPLTLFNPLREYPFVAHPLDRIQFVPITASEFTALKRENTNHLLAVTTRKK